MAFLYPKSEYRTRITVRNPSDFGPISGGRVTPDPTKLYMLDGMVDMDSVSVEVPSGGLSIAGLNGGRDVLGMYSSRDNYTMFVSPVGGYSGNVVMESMTVYHTGANSKIFDLDNDGNSNAIDITGVNFGTFGSTTVLGELTDYRQILMNGVGFIFIADGLTFNGSWTGLAVVTSIAVGFPANKTLFMEGTSLTFSGTVRSDMNFLSVQASSVLFDFQESNITNDDEFRLENVRTTADDAIPNFSHKSSKANFFECVGIPNTYVGAQWTLSTEVTTVISAIDTPAKVAGTTTYVDEQWFTNTTDNAFVYDSDQPVEIECKGVAAFSSTNNRVLNIWFRLWDDSASAYVDGHKNTITTNGGGRAEGVSLLDYFTISENDRIEVWTENTSSNANITMLEGGLVSVTKRAN